MEGQSLYLPETVTQASAIRFESGIHPKTESDKFALYDTYAKGNLDAHAWNKEVSERIASYAYDAPALLLTIDGLEPVPLTSNPLFTPLQEAGIVWTHLPARPNTLNHTGKLYVVKGDSYYLQIPHAVLPNIENNTSFYPQMDATFQSEKENALRDFQTAIGGETAIIGSLGLLLWGANKLISSKSEDQKLSRRKFLGKALALAAGTFTAGSLLRYPIPTIAGAISNEPTEEFLQTVDSIVRPRLVRSTFTDGRTALLLAKAEDAQAANSDLSEATNVVIMGSQHMDIVPTFQQDKDQRNKAIAAYALELLDVAKQVYGSFYHISPDQYRNKLRIRYSIM